VQQFAENRDEARRKAAAKMGEMHGYYRLMSGSPIHRRRFMRLNLLRHRLRWLVFQ